MEPPNRRTTECTTTSIPSAELQTQLSQRRTGLLRKIIQITWGDRSNVTLMPLYSGRYAGNYGSFLRFAVIEVNLTINKNNQEFDEGIKFMEVSPPNNRLASFNPVATISDILSSTMRC